MFNMPILRTVLLLVFGNSSLRGFLENSRFGRRVSARFVAGKTVDEALEVAMRVNGQGMEAALGWLGPEPKTEVDAYRAVEIYHKLLEGLEAHGHKAQLCVKLTQFGEKISPELAETVTGDLVRSAKAAGCFVFLDMENADRVQKTFDIARRLHAQGAMRDAVGVAVQAQLYRSEADVEQLVADGLGVRLCKGASMESSEVAFPRKVAVDANYLRVAEKLLGGTVLYGLATHDEAMIEKVKAVADERWIDRKDIEFQMLYGVRRDLQKKLVEEGYRVRVYVPFGPEWYPYFLRRLIERPANFLFTAKSFFWA